MKTAAFSLDVLNIFRNFAQRVFYIFLKNLKTWSFYILNKTWWTQWELESMERLIMFLFFRISQGWTELQWKLHLSEIITFNVMSGNLRDFPISIFLKFPIKANTEYKQWSAMGNKAYRRKSLFSSVIWLSIKRQEILCYRKTVALCY